MTEKQRRAMKASLKPFESVLAVIDALPASHMPSDATPLRENLPGAWPSLGDLRSLVASVAAASAKPKT